MILVLLAAACLVSVPLTGGRLTQLGTLRLRLMWLAPLALAIQVAIITVAPSGHQQLHAAFHLLTYVLVGVFLAANAAPPGAPVIALGTLTNTIAIAANGAVMPASAAAMRLAGLSESGAGFRNSTALTHPHLLWLGDIIPVPGPLPNVLSVGDCLIFLGMLILLHRTCGRSASPTLAQASAEA